MKKILISLTLTLTMATSTQSQQKISIPKPGDKTLLNSGWIARRANEVKIDGNTLTAKTLDTNGWLTAVVPGTVLTTLLKNGHFPPPEFSLNNNLIPDIHDVGPEFYTFWFVKQFTTDPIPEGQKLLLNFRGINYKAEIFLNGKRINSTTHEGMFIRKTFEITKYINDTINTLAVIVYPPEHPGNPNGGQGGDGQIARNVTMQFTPGWDWIQPVRDRNTGIWDQVAITTTGPVQILNPYVTTRVPGLRQTDGKQKDAYVNIETQIQNTSDIPQTGQLTCRTDRQTITTPITLAPGETRTVKLKELTIRDPKLWWPNGIANPIGKQPLYNLNLSFDINNTTSDIHNLRYGIREITSDKDPETGGRRFFVNGQPIYITGGNYIASDWLLRLSPERYRAEIRFHAEMHMRMIRIWGGALLERPEFYDACDEYGLLVFQDLWGSGDCNGAWNDNTKFHTRERRWEYPDNHRLFIESVADQVKMIRNHPSLALWCGANEWPLAEDIDKEIRANLLPKLDPTRLFASYSTDTTFTRNTIGGVGDGPYGIQEPQWFFTFRSTPFNPEAGSVGTPEIESMREMMTPEELQQHPRNGRTRNATWTYHKDLGYGPHLERYGPVDNIETYCKYAQAVNYDQYRSFMEGWASHMWTWYTGILIWKTQNPWTALRGQMYDRDLDVNASLYGVQQGSEPLHAQYNPITRKAEIINTTTNPRNIAVKAATYSRNGDKQWETTAHITSQPNKAAPLFDIPPPENPQGVYFIKLTVTEADSIISTHIYWPTTQENDFTTLSALPRSTPRATLALTTTPSGCHEGTITLEAGPHISFFNRIKVFNKTTGRRILPTHYSDNYITLMPHDRRQITLSINTPTPLHEIEITIESWTADPQKLTP